jgi:hypothetical protein
MSSPALHDIMANAIRGLAIDGVEAAKSGHPGAPMGLADAATVLWTRHLKFDAAAPDWADRDRFILSAGHASMLIYSLLPTWLQHRRPSGVRPYAGRRDDDGAARAGARNGGRLRPRRAQARE